jgi:hypothetical protein
MSETKTKQTEQTEQKLIDVYIVHYTAVSYQNGGYDQYTYLCKNKEIAIKKAEELHRHWCECDSDRDYEHTYEKCKNDDINIWIQNGVIDLDRNIMMDIRCQI